MPSYKPVGRRYFKASELKRTKDPDRRKIVELQEAWEEFLLARSGYKRGVVGWKVVLEKLDQLKKAHKRLKIRVILSDEELLADIKVSHTS